MLAPRRMSSHGGQSSLPFGYNGHVIDSIGLPDFMTPGPPMGQSILNDEENVELNNFFSDFDSNHPNPNLNHPYTMAPGNQMQYNMPPYFVGSETSRGQGSGIDPHHLQNGPYHVFGNSLAGQSMHPMVGQGPFVQNIHGYHDNGYQEPLLHQLQSAAASVHQPPQPGFTPHWNHQPFQTQGLPLQTPGRGPPMRFGSDSHFGPSGFQPPSGLMEQNDTQSLDWLESGPNTQPNTQPSSPNWSKKRKIDDYHSDRRNGYPHTNGHVAQPSPPNSNPRRKQLTNIKTEGGRPSTSTSQPPTPLTNSKPQSPVDDTSDDAAAESDDDPSSHPTANPTRSPSPPAPWPSSKARPPKSNKPPPPPKPSRKRKKSTTTATPARKPPSKPTRTPSARVPLTNEQKKANHTNSEQRRRDATARAYAQLYDLVPEVSENGKQSTMKKLELVVAKVSDVTQAVERLRTRLGIQAGGSVAAIARSQGYDFSTMAQLGASQQQQFASADDADEGMDGDEQAGWGTSVGVEGQHA